MWTENFPVNSETGEFYSYKIAEEPYCAEYVFIEEEWPETDWEYDDEEDEFFGDIIIDPSVINNSKVKCVLDGLLNDGNTLSDTIVKFADESVDIDLNIEVGEIDNDDPGILISSNLSEIFTLRIDKSRSQERLPIQIATTIMHEAIHVEMRRYLYGATDVSTLPDFPGSFAEDWVLYVI